MLIIATYTYGFKIPDEIDMYEKFKMVNDIRDYTVSESSNYICCSRTVFQTTTDKKGED